MDANVVLLVIIGCCVFSACVVALATLVPASAGLPKWLSLKDALAGFKFESGSPLPNIQQRIKSVRPQSFEVRTNFGAPPSENIGEPQDKDNADCSALCFGTENCTGYELTGSKCQLKGNVTIINYEKGKEIRVSGDVGRTKFGQVPYDIVDKGQPVLKTLQSGLADAITQCYEDSTCKAFTYENGTANLYANVVVTDSSKVGNTYIKFDAMPSSGFLVPGRKYTDSGETATYHVDDPFFKPATFAPPPAAAPGSEPWQVYPSDLKFFQLWQANWNAGREKSGRDPTTGPGISVDSLEHCANLCLSNSSCQSFVWAKDGSKKCWFRSDLTRDNMTNYVCNEPTGRSGDDPANTKGCNGLSNLVNRPDTDPGNGVVFGCGGRATGYCWSENGSRGDSNKDTYYKMQDPMSKTCPQACGQDPECHASQWTKNDCTMLKFQPTVAAQDSNFTTQWKFDYFPGQ